MEYIEYVLSDSIDFTHPYMTINQMKKMIRQNYQKPRDFFLYGESSEDLIKNLDDQFKMVFPYGVNEENLRMPVLVFPIPTGEMWDPVRYGFIVKYEANGETHVYSPIEIKELKTKSQ